MRQQARSLHSLLLQRAPAGLVLRRVGSLWSSNPATAGKRGFEAQIRRAISGAPEPVRGARLQRRPRLRKCLWKEDPRMGLGWLTAADQTLSPRLAPTPFSIRSLRQFVKLNALPVITQVK